MGKTLRTFSLAVAGVCALATGLLFASCDNFGGDVASFDPALFFVAGGTQDAAGGTNVGQSGGQAVGALVPQSLGSLSANVSIPNMPALPTAATTPGAIQASDGATNASALDISNSAVPDIADATGTGYKFTATLAQAGAGGATYTAEGTYAAGVCSFEFADARSSAEQNYTLTVSLYYSDALVASGEKAVTVAAGAADFTADVSLAPNTASGASNGTLALPIKFSDTSVTSVGVNLIDSGGTDVAATYVEGGSSVALTSGAGTIASVTGGLPPGTYTLLMTFKKGSAQVGARTETLNVYPTLATKVWWTNSSAGLVSELVITSYDQTEFWVKGEGGVFYSDVYTAYTGAGLDTNVGSFAAPLATIQEAVDRIKASGDTTTQYTVYIDGKIEGDPDADYSANEDSLVKVGSSSALCANNILFKGWTGPDTDIIDLKKDSASTNKGRAFYVRANSTTKISVQDLRITHGYSSGFGGAVYYKFGNLEIKNCVINQNTGKYGGAICVLKEPFAGNAVVTIVDSEISSNDAFDMLDGGGGVYVGQESVLYIRGSSQISGNNALATGGGVYIANSSAKCFISGAATIGQSLASTSSCATSADGSHSNSAQYGGGIYNKGELYLGYTDDSTPAAWTGSVCYNYASSDGGGVYSNGSSSLVKMNAGSVAYNLCSDGSETTGGGGGVAVKNSSAFTMSGGTVSYNQTNNKVGGGIYVDSGATLTLNGTAEVSSNKTSPDGTGTMGGAGLFAYRAAITMEGNAVVKDNLCKACGGGVYLYEYESASSYASLAMSGNAKILENTSSDGLGGAVYVTQRCSFSMQGAATIPAGVAGTTGAGKNDVYLDTDTNIGLAGSLTSATTPVATITPSSYNNSRPVVRLTASSTATLALETPKFAVTRNPSTPAIVWSVDEYGNLLRETSETFYVSSDSSKAGDDASHDGSVDHPFASINYAASKFSDPTAPVGGSAYNPTFKNRIYILDNITFSAGAGATGDCNFEVVGCAGGVEGSPVTLTFNTDSGSGFYVAPGQKVKLTDINITQSSGTNEYAALMAAVGGELFLEDCSITGMRAKKCSAIAAEGPVHLKNVSVKNNVAIAPSEGGYVWGPAVFSKQGQISLLGKVEITGNYMEIPDGGGAGGTVQKEQNVWVGDNKDGTAYYEPLYVAGVLTTGTEIGVTTYDISKTVFTENYKNAGNAASPDTYFTSDDGFAVGWNSASKEAQLKVPSSLYVSATGSDLTGNGTSARPYATITKAVEKTAWFNDATKNYTINVAAGSYLSQAIVIDSSGTLGPAPVAASITITGNSKTTSILSGNGGDSIINIFDNAVPLTIKKLRFTNGIAGTFGGAIDVEYSTPGTTSAEILIEDCLFDTCSSSGSSSGGGGAINICSGATVKVKDTTFTGNSAVNGGAIYNSGTCYVYGSTVIGNASAAGTDAAGSATSKHSNSASANGGAIYNAGKLYLGYSSYTSPSVCTPEAFTGGIYYNYANRGGGIYNNTSAEVVIASGTYKRNGVAADSGGGAIFNAGSLTMNDGLIDSNAGDLGAGVYVTGAGSFTMNDGTISGNTAGTSVGGGGGVLAAGAFTMNGGTISGNSGHFGGGVWIYSGTGTIAGGEISGNKAEVGAGLCVYTSSVASGSAIVEASMTNGTISANIGTLYGGTESCGGGVYVHENCKFHISDGTIKQNTATKGGAVYANFNSAESTYGEFRISGGAMIPAGNSSGATGAGKNDVRCVPPIVIGGDLTATAPVATVTPGAYNTSQKILYAESATLLEDNHDKFDVTPNGTETWSIDENGYLSQSAAGAGSVTIYTPDGQFNLSVNKTTITTSASTTTVTVTAKNSSGTDISTSTDFSDWTIDCYYGTSVTPVKTQSGRQFTFATNYPKGAYRLTVTVKYKGAEYSDSFVITKTVD